ncbi:hypothetical protein BY996DRAFT_6413102 [Phakopsora pachyrhizi]|uniref:Expressed protein n=1 Tax=Phakopsora pachyrhizi TaxID=170000 RepID=A0AAV0BTG0_PHAPC|nr:hypothetical protein BY996DRAFT_6418438 [Phakopsora pachyrhizi]KAI8455508.1 hypothetical protein BY996DRAFT_6413102 [Phakopsora pachyrhizi]CAH7689532.1 expressed protein [Phakopsora pachyrhizi]CAH7690006.1 expressed protein [Phakopsora pachyrhizi]
MTLRKRSSVIVPSALSPGRLHSQTRRTRGVHADLKANNTTAVPNLYSVEPKASKSSRKPAFKVYCDVYETEPIMNPIVNLDRRPVLGLMKSISGLQTVVNEKENRNNAFEHEGIVLDKRSSVDLSINRQILGDKASQPAGTNCVEHWGGKVPFQPCSPDRVKPKQTFHTSRDKVLGSSRNLRTSGRWSHESDAGNQLYPENQESSIFSSSIFTTIGESQKQSHSFEGTATEEVDSLVARLEALGTAQQYDGGDSPDDTECTVNLIEPLPADAICPGAPKIPSSSTMPSFDDGDDFNNFEFGAKEVAVNIKPLCQHQMSPLAEVTEAYTGQQGGWSPPLEYSSSASDESLPVVFTTLPTIAQDERNINPTGKKNRTSIAADSEFILDNSTPRFKRRRDQALMTGRQATASTSKPLLRI